MLLATITNTSTLDELLITKSPGASAPACLSFSDQVCAYWESRFELFIWACETAGWNPENVLFHDAFTQELLDYYQLLDEDYELVA